VALKSLPSSACLLPSSELLVVALSRSLSLSLSLSVFITNNLLLFFFLFFLFFLVKDVIFFCFLVRSLLIFVHSCKEYMCVFVYVPCSYFYRNQFHGGVGGWYLFHRVTDAEVCLIFWEVFWLGIVWGEREGERESREGGRKGGGGGEESPGSGKNCLQSGKNRIIILSQDMTITVFLEWGYGNACGELARRFGGACCCSCFFFFVSTLTFSVLLLPALLASESGKEQWPRRGLWQTHGIGEKILISSRLWMPTFLLVCKLTPSVHRRARALLSAPSPVYVCISRSFKTMRASDWWRWWSQ